uniref:Uncharacterized protein n=1 Tax=Noctiluca scintillans TaxID=2966 RepID=A7WQB5_NOCSC|nr:unknown [Noctiluca scintillans]ABV22408.1 unknown [Noctiluca scintillans]
MNSVLISCAKPIARAMLRGTRALALGRPLLSDAPAGPPCGSACATPTSCAPDTPAKADIAHKAVGSAGATYGYSQKYAEGWERIFAKKKQAATNSSATVSE